MKKLIIALALVLEIHAPVSSFAQGTAFTYQGRLTDGSGPANGNYDLRFILYDNSAGGSQQGPILIKSATTVSNGLFTVALDFGNQFPGADRWMEIAVRTNGAASFTTLSARQALTPAPYAITAGNIVSGGIPSGTYINAVTFNNSANSFGGTFSGNGSGLTNLNASALNGLSSSNFWNTSGNSNTTAAVNYLGTADNQPLELHVNGARSLRMEPGGPSGAVGNGVFTGAPNMIGGAVVNYVSNSVVGATISGGGTTNYGGAAYSNSVTADFGTVAGGIANSASFQFATVGGGAANVSSNFAAIVPGGYRNTAGGYAATVAGGFYNTANGTGSFVGGGGYDGIVTAGNQASGVASMVGGGMSNSASGPNSFIGGGEQNLANGQFASLGGGLQNTASGNGAAIGGGYANTAGGFSSTVAGGNGSSANGYYSTVPGGVANVASGDFSFAAGSIAQAIHGGAFVWADSQTSSGSYSSDRNNQVKFRAAGGMILDVSGSSGLNPAALRINSTSANGVGIFVAQTSSDATAVFTAAGTGDVIKGFNGGNGGNPVFEVINSGDVYGHSFNSTSDRNAKENFSTVSAAEILDRVLSLPVTRWNFKSESDKEHIGPMAQDFHEAFGLNGADDKHISMTDEGGVALAAIQGLNRKLEERTKQLETENVELKQTVAQLKSLVAGINEKLERERK